MSTISESLVPYLVGLTSSRAVWLALEKMFSSQSRARLTDLLASIGEPISDSAITSYILAGLPHDYDSLIATVNTRVEAFPLDELYGHLLTHELRIDQQALSPPDITAPTANFAAKTSQPSQNRGRQFYSQHGRGRGRGRTNSSRGRGSPQFYSNTGSFWLLSLPLVRSWLFRAFAKICLKDLSSGVTLLSGKSKNGLYPLHSLQRLIKPTALLGERVSVEQWHSRLGHPALRIAVVHPMQTRGKDNISKPKVFFPGIIKYPLPKALLATTDQDSTEPTSYTAASKHPAWRAAMNTEFTALLHNGTWKLVPPKPTMNLGFHQQPSIDYGETFSPVIKPVTIRTVLSLAVASNWDIRQLDVTNAFLHGVISEDVYMTQPPGFVHASYPNHVYHLHKALYGLKQAPQAWFSCLSNRLLQLGFHGCLYLSQHRYIHDLLRKTNMHEAKPISSPMASSTSLSQFQGTPLSDPSSYRSTVGSLQYLSLTRPDIAFAVNKVCQFMTNPTDLHWSAVKRILRYLKHISHHSLLLHKDSNFTIQAFSDADWAGSPDDRRSTSGYCLFLGRNLISWSSRKQRTVSRFSTESEYRAIAHASAELVWLRSLLSELGVPSPSTPILWCDNIGATYLTANPLFHARTKHIEIDFHFVRDLVSSKTVSVQFISSKDQVADTFTKPLPITQFISLHANLNVCDLRLRLRGRIETTSTQTVTAPPYQKQLMIITKDNQPMIISKDKHPSKES
uniref:Reverse transcriptase Ty1/copia-type domain-containing protein n=1 Tax=Fagus sylvatica TaxID=28930 RepID=A0A2N9I1U4_FAGSY